MTKQKSFKQRVRARMDKTGESYSSARRQLIAKSNDEHASGQSQPTSVAPTGTADETLRARTGRGWDEWFALLDADTAHERTHGAIAKWLVEEHDVAGWWAQHITVAYEQARGLRVPGQKSDGTYGVSASKTIGVSVGTLFSAWADESVRREWLGDADLTVRTSRPCISLTAAWGDGSSRIAVGFVDKGPDKSAVSMSHERITDPTQADDLRAFWRARLAALKALLEA